MLSFFQPNPTTKKQKTDSDAPQILPEPLKALSTKTDGCESSDKFLLASLVEDIDNGWSAALAQETQKPYFRQLNDFVSKDMKTHEVYPRTDNIFAALRLCSIDDVKGY